MNSNPQTNDTGHAMRYRLWWVSLESDPVLICEGVSKESVDFDFAHLTEPARWAELKGRFDGDGELQYREHDQDYQEFGCFKGSVLLDHWPRTVSKERVKDLEDAVEAWKLQARDYEDILMDIVALTGDPNHPTEYDPREAAGLVRAKLFPDLYLSYCSNCCRDTLGYEGACSVCQPDDIIEKLGESRRDALIINALYGAATLALEYIEPGTQEWVG